MAFISSSVFLRGSWTQRTSEKKVCSTLSPTRRVAARGLTVKRPAVPAPHSPVALQVREVSAEELEVALQANARPMLVDAFAKWCGPCQFLLPQLDIVAEKFGDRLDILKFDTEQYPKLASALRVRGLPTLFFVKDGKLRYRMEGALTAEQLEEVIEFVLFDGPPPSFAAPQEPNPS